MKVHILWFTCLQRSLNHHVGTLLGMTISFGPAKPSQSDQIMISGCSGSRLQHVLMYCSSDMRMTKSSITLALPLAAAAACNRCMWVHRHCLPLLLSQWLTLRGGARWWLLRLPPRGNWPGTNTSRPISSWATATKILWRPATTTCSAGLFLVYQILSRKVCCLGMLQLPSRLWGTHVVQLACAPNFKRWLGGAYFASLVALDTARPEWDPAELGSAHHGWHRLALLCCLLAVSVGIVLLPPCFALRGPCRLLPALFFSQWLIEVFIRTAIGSCYEQLRT